MTSNKKPTRNILKLENIDKSYTQAGKKITILQGASLKINQGEMVALVGPSGSGKSTLLHIAGLLDNNFTGNVEIAGQKINKNDYTRTKLRLHNIGFIYQFHHLLSEFNAVENVSLPLLLKRFSKDHATEKAENLLKKFGLQKRFTHFPTELSGGEQQRVAIARALIDAPKLLLADEPTGNLDQNTANDVFDTFYSMAKETHQTCFIVTHNIQIAEKMDRIFTLKNAKLVDIT